jgi:hypothetical protein
MIRNRLALMTVCVLILSLFGGPTARAHDLPVYSVKDGLNVDHCKEYLPNPIQDKVLGGGVLPVVNEQMLNDPPFQWAARKLASRHINGDTLGEQWDLVTIGCGYGRQERQGWCSVAFDASQPIGGTSSYYSFPVHGDPTRSGRRSFWIVGRRVHHSAGWWQIYYFNHKAVRSAFTAKITQARP